MEIGPRLLEIEKKKGEVKGRKIILHMLFPLPDTRTLASPKGLVFIPKGPIMSRTIWIHS